MPTASPAGWLPAFPAAERQAARASYARMRVGRIEFAPATQARGEDCSTRGSALAPTLWHGT